MTVRRVKTYSGQTGYVYQYVFVAQRRTRRGWFRGGTEYLFEVSSDRKNSFVMPVYLADEALKAWRKAHGRDLSATEQYAAAKVCLFRAFDERENLFEDPSGVEVSAENIGELLDPLGID